MSKKKRKPRYNNWYIERTYITMRMIRDSPVDFALVLAMLIFLYCMAPFLLYGVFTGSFNWFVFIVSYHAVGNLTYCCWWAYKEIKAGKQDSDY